MGKKKISNKNKKQENFERDNFLRRGLFDGKEQIKKWPLAALFLIAEHWLILRCLIQKTLSSMRILDITGFVHFLQMKVKIQQPQGFMNRFRFSIRLGALYVPPLFPPPPAQLRLILSIVGLKDKKNKIKMMHSIECLFSIHSRLLLSLSYS